MNAMKKILCCWEQSDTSDDSGGSNDLLHRLVSHNDIDIVRLFLEKGADVNAKNSKGETPLHVAVSYGYVDIVSLFIEKGADVNAKNSRGKTSLHLAEAKEFLEIVQLLKNKDDKVKGTADAAPLHEAVANGTVKEVKLLLENGTDATSKAYRPKPGPYKTCGAKKSNHGTLYQLRLILCFLLRALNNAYVFRIGTEVAEAEQFDDLVFEYRDKESGIKRKLFLQAKNLQNSNKRIGFGDLLSSNKKAEFSLLKYYESYLKLKEKPGMKADEIDLAICTNIHLRLDNAGKVTEPRTTRLLPFTKVTEPYKEFFIEGECYQLGTDDQTLQLFSSEYQTCLNTEEKQDFKTFLTNLIFVVKQPVDREKIKRELSTFAGTKVKDINLLYDLLYMKMYDWYMKKEGTYLTDELVQDIIQTIVNNLATVSISGMRRVYAVKLLTSPVAFNSSKVEGLLDMISQHNIVHLISPKGNKLTAILVAQALSQSDYYKTDESYIFMRLNSLLLNSSQVTNAFTSSVNNGLLVIGCLSKTKDRSESGSELTNLGRELMAIVSRNPKKKMVLIAPEDHPLPAMFNDRIRHNATLGFQDLTLESQAVLLATSVTLQGESVQLSHVIDHEDKGMLDILPLVDLISDEGLVIGTDLPTSPGYNESFYIERSVINHIEINVEIFQEKLNDHIAKTESEFHQLCTEHPGANIHWIKEENGRFIWVKSNGELHALQRYINRSNSQSCPEDVFLESVKDQKVVIVSDTAGMGKSTILCHISKRFKENHTGKLVFRVDLNNFSQVLKQRKSLKSNKSSTIDFFCNTLITTQSENCKELSKELLKREGKVVLLFDGFDEISPDYDDLVISLIQDIKKDTKAQIWITTRPFMREKLENKLHQFSCTLKPFTEQNQCEFLTKYWKHMLKKDVDKTRLNSYALSLVQQLSKSISDKEREFTGIPLQVRMLAECFMNGVSGSSAPNLGEQFHLVNLYDKFIKSKYEIFFKEKNKEDDSKIGAEERQEMFKAHYKKIHQRYACCLLFSEEKTKLLFPNLYPDGSPESNVNRIGILNVNGVPHFVHRTFAEYLCADFVTDLFKAPLRDDIIDFVLSKLLVSDTYLVCRAFLNGLLGQTPTQGSLSSFGRKMDTFFGDKQDTVERIFYLTAEEGNQNILEYLCNALQDHSPILKKLLGCRFYAQKTMLHVAAIGRHDNVIQKVLCWSRDIMDEDKDLVRNMLLAVDGYEGNALHEAASYGYDNVIKTLLCFARDIMVGDKDLVKDILLSTNGYGRTALHWAAIDGHDQVIETLLCWARDIVDGDKDRVRELLLAVDGDGGTALHWAARGGHEKVILTLLSWSRDRVDVNKVLVGENLLTVAAKDGRTALHFAAYGGHDNVIQTLLGWTRGIVDGDKNLVRKMLLAYDKDESTALHWAARGAHDNVIKTLVSRSRDIKDGDKDLGRKVLLAVDREKRTALHVAATGGLDNVIKTLLSCICGFKDGDKDLMRLILLAVDGDERTALHLAATGGLDNVIKTLLSCTRDISRDGDKDIVKKMLLAVNGEKRTALHVAATGGLDNVIKTLLNCTRDISRDVDKDLVKKILLAFDGDGRTALHVAATGGLDNAIKTLLNCTRDISRDVDKDLVKKILLAFDGDGRTALHVAATGGLDNAIKTLLSCTRDIMDGDKNLVRKMILAVDKEKRTSLHVAARGRPENVVQTLLFYLVENMDDGDKDLVRKMLLAKVDQGTALYWMTTGGYDSLIQTCLSCTRDIMDGDKNVAEEMMLVYRGGSTAQHLAAAAKYDKEGQNLLQVALGMLSHPIVRQMLLAVIMLHGSSALNMAARRGQLNFIQIFLQWTRFFLENCQATVEELLLAVDEDGNTALHRATKGGHDKVIQKLLQTTRDMLDEETLHLLLGMRDEEGRTALEIAAVRSDTASAKMLRRFGAEPA